MISENNPFKSRIDLYKGKPDKDVLNYLYNFWQLDGTPNGDGTFWVVASYQYRGKDKNGFDCGYFVDIRGLNGDLLYYPFRLGRIQIYTTHKEFLTKKPLWKICVKLSEKEEYRWKNPFLLQLADNKIEEPENVFWDRLKKEKLIKELFDRRGKTKDDAQTIANALNILIDDVRTDSERFIFELLQNADDQPFEGQPVDVTFKTLIDHLLVLHNGNPFSTEDIQVITNIGDKSSDKIKNEEKTGYKGIGFKSVFSDSDTVYIDSGGFSFAFDKHSPVYNKESDIDAIPWQIKPIWQERYRLPKEVVGESSFFDSRVGIALNSGHENVIKYKTIIPNLLEDPRFLLFLRHIKSIRYESDTSSISALRTISNGRVILNNGNVNSEWIIQDYNIFINDNIKRILSSGESNKIPQKLRNATNTRITFAINYMDGAVQAVEKSLLFSYLPTKVTSFKFPFLVNADFSLNSSRESVHEDVKWNEFLFEIIGKKTIEWIKSISNIKGYLNALPVHLEESDSPLFNIFCESYKSALKSESFILNQKGGLSRQDEIIIDNTSLSQVIGAELFCELIDTSKLLPSDSIDDSIWKNNIFEEIETINFDKVINSITDNPKFNQWFVSATDELKEKLYNWIVKHNTESSESKIKEFVDNLPLYEGHSFAEIEHNNGCIEEYRTINECNENAMADDECGEKEFIRCHLENLGESFLDDYYTGVYRSSEYGIIITNHTAAIKDILQDIGFRCFDNDVNDGHPLYPFINKQDEAKLFDIIKGYDFSSLDEEKRKRLFLSLKSFNDVGPAALKGLPLFRNANGAPKPLSEMMRYTPNMPSYVFPYMLSEDDYSSDLTEYIIDDGRVFDDVVWKHKDDLGIAITELYSTWKWSDEKYTKELIEQYKKDNKLSSLLPIIEDSRPETKKYYLDSIERIDLQSEIRYTRLSWQYRVLQMAVSVYDDPTCFSAKIFFDGQCINSLSVSNEVACYYGPKEKGQPVKFSLAKLLPQYKIQSDVIEKFKSAFEEEKNLDKFLVVKEMALSSIVKRLEDKDYLGLTYGEWKYDKGGNAHQYLFYVYYYRHVKGWNSNYVIHIKLENESDAFIRELMDFLYNNKIDIKTSPFTFRIHQYFTGKYFDNNFIFDTEQLLPAIEKWCGDDNSKKEYLYANGVRRNTDYTIKFRQLFQRNEAIDFVAKMSDADLATSVRFIAQTDGYERPFVGDNQRAVLLSLIKEKKLSNLTSKWNLGKINQESKEWDSKQYAQWIKNHHPNIYFYPGELPNRLYYNTNDVLLLDYEDDVATYYYDKNSSRLFINGEKNINDQLIKIVQDGNIPFTVESFRFLCLEGNDLISREEIEENKRINEEKDKKITELQEELKLYKSIFGEITSINERRESVIQETNTSENDKVKHIDGRQEGAERSYKEKERAQYEQAIRSFLGGSFNLDQYNRKSEHIISCYRILKYLEGQGVQFAPDFDRKQFVNSDDYQQIKLQDGIYVNPSSAKWGVWYIHPNVWRDIVINGNWACVCTGNGENDFILIKSEEGLEHIANTGESVIMKMSTSDNHNVFEVTNTVFPGVGNESMDIYLMIKLHDTPNEVCNSLFDKVFALAQNDFIF